MNCFPSMTGGDIRDNILQMQINSELGHSLSINKIGTKTQINLLAKNGDILSTYEIPDANASNIKSMELVDQSIVLTFSDNSSVTCSLADIYSKIDTKQDTISDLNAIREGATKGSTAVQPADLDSYAKASDLDEVASNAKSYTDENLEKLSADVDKKIFRLLPNKDSTFIDGFYPNILPISTYEDDKTKYRTSRSTTAPNDTLQSLGVGSLQADFVASPATGILFTIGSKTSSSYSISPINCSDSGIIGLWLYFEKKSTDSSITLNTEITSSGKPDYQEIYFTLNNSNVKEGWNFYKFDLLATDEIPVRSGCIKGIRTNGTVTDPDSGPFDVSAVNFVRMHFIGGGSTKNCIINIGPMALLTKPLNNEFAYYDDYINALIDTKLGVIENGTY